VTAVLPFDAAVVALCKACPDLPFRHAVNIVTELAAQDTYLVNVPGNYDGYPYPSRPVPSTGLATANCWSWRDAVR
jgi:hypothetical protein